MMHQHQSPGGRRRWAQGVDMYRRVPADLTEGTGSGSIFSYMAVFAMLMLFMMETREYMGKRSVIVFFVLCVGTTILLPVDCCFLMNDF